MRLIVLLAGLYCLHNTDFASANWWYSKAFPVIDFFFIQYLVIDLVLFIFLLQHGESLRARQHAEDNLWHWLYESVAKYIDKDGSFAGIWYWAGVSIEVVLMLLSFVYAGGLMIDALMYTGV